MGFGLIAFGFLFFVNPNFNIIDFFPDFIGLFLIVLGLTRVSLLNEDLKAAKKNAFIFAFVDMAKLLCIGFLSSGNDPTSYLLFSFTFGVIECILFSSFIKALFDGVDHIGIRYSSSAILAHKTKKNGHTVELSTKTRTSLVVFYFVRTILSVLPELSELQLADDTVISGQIIYSRFKGMFYFFSALAVLAVGIPCIIRTFRFFRGISKEKDFCERIKTLETDFLENNRTYFVSRRMKTSLWLYTAALAVLVIPWRDGMPFVPTALSAVLVVMSLFFAGKRSLPTLISSTLLFAASIYGTLLRESYYDKNDIFDAARKEVCKTAFIRASAVSALECVLILITFVSASAVVIKTVRSHSSFAAMRYSGKTIDRELITSTVDGKARHQQVAQRVFVVLFAVIGAVMPFASLYSVIYTRSLGSAARNTLDLPSRLVMAGSVIEEIIAVIWLCVTVSFVAFAYNELYSTDLEWNEI